MTYYPRYETKVGSRIWSWDFDILRTFNTNKKLVRVVVIDDYVSSTT